MYSVQKMKELARFIGGSIRYGRKSGCRSKALCVAVGQPGRDNGGPAESPQKAIQACREAINILNKQELSLQSQVTIAETEARALLRLGDRSGAETSLKKREIVLREVDRLHHTRVSLLSQILLVETATTRQVAVEALASGVAAHRRMSRKLFEETQLEKLEDALLEQASFETEIAELLGQGFKAISNFDDDTTMNIKKSLVELEHDEVVNALAEANYQGVCSAESFEGTGLSTIPVNPSAIAFPSESPVAEDAIVLSPVQKLNEAAGQIPLSATLMTTMASVEDDTAAVECELWNLKNDAALS